MGSFVRKAGVAAATTLGAGIFALPYAFYETGWGTALFYLVFLGFCVASVHALYFRALGAVGERSRVLGLARARLGRGGFALGFVGIVGGLLLTLVAYLLLAGQFLGLVLPSLSFAARLAIFWCFASLPALLNVRLFANFEFVLAAFVAVAVGVVFIFAPHPGALFSFPPLRSPGSLAVFGAVLFALAGWTAVEPVYEVGKREGGGRGRAAVFLAGTTFVVLLYFLFVLGIFGSGARITPDTLSGLAPWPFWKQALLILMGLLGMWASYGAIGREIENAVGEDMGVGKRIGVAVALLAPPLLVVAGLRNFITIVEVAGGVFLGLQYVLLILVSRSLLKLTGVRDVFFKIVAFLFVLAALYEIARFVLQ